MSEDLSSPFNAISGPNSSDNAKSINPSAKKRLSYEEEIHFFPTDRVEITREIVENPELLPYNLTNNPDINRYIETLNRSFYFSIKDIPPEQ